MATVSETEFQQKTSEYIHYVKDFIQNLDVDRITLYGDRDGSALYLQDEEVILKFLLSGKKV